MQNFTPIGKAPAEKSVTVRTNKAKKAHSKLSIPRYTTYGRKNIGQIEVISSV